MTRVFGAVLAGVALSAGIVGVAQASTAGARPMALDDYHEITVLHSGKCLDLDISGNHAFENGSKVQQWDCLGGTNQFWKLVALADGTVELHVRSSEKCLDIDVSRNQSFVDGAKAQQWDCNGAANQHFWVIPGSIGGYVNLVALHSGKCLDEDISGNNGFKNGGKVQQWVCNGSTNQLWQIQP